MLVTFLAENMLGQTLDFRAAAFAGRRRAKIHRFADVAVGFGPGFADFENFDCGKFEPAPIENRGTRSGNWQRCSKGVRLQDSNARALLLRRSPLLESRPRR